MGADRLRRLGLGRSRHAVPHHDQRLAHLPAGGPDQRVEPVLGVHVPRRHGLQSGLAQPAAVPQRGRRVRRRGFEHAVRLWTIVLEISVMMAQFPSKEIAELSYEYRTLGLGYANIGGLLMTSGIPYDSPEGRAICGALTAIMTGVAYATSAEMAASSAPSRAMPTNREAHAARHAQPSPRRAWRRATATRSSPSAPVPLDARRLPRRRSWSTHATRRLGPAPSSSARSTATATPRRP